ncbi:MAG: choice-of-anchor Q domain-containing protein [Solirubrobacteraceae bacterium]
MTEYGSVIAANGSGAGAQNCVGAITDDAYNVTYPHQAFSDCPGVIADPKLGLLAFIGGGLERVPLRAGSAAIDIEPPGGACPASDERGVARPQNGRCDAGAYESAPPQLTNVAVAATGPTTATVNASVDANLQDTNMAARFETTTAYGVTSHTVDAGAGGAPVRVSLPLIGLAASTTYHVALVASNPDGTVTSTDMTFTTAAGPSSGGAGGGGRGRGAPIITNARQSALRWLPSRTRATLTRGHALPVGTTFTFGLDQTAEVTLTFTHMASGRLVRRHCRAPSRRNEHRPKCTRALVAGTLLFAAHAGANRIRFYGRLSRRAQLTPGDYAVDIGAINGAGRRSGPRRLRFTIAKP